ncbi:MAG: hypothetical protein HKN10_11145 [Myxococcales bacterium]|nr:hypothetical protein [Myxococcales bacterium]
MFAGHVLRLAAVLAWVACASASIASAEAKAPEEEKELLNAVSLGGAYAFQLDRDRDSATTGEPLRTRESLGGFVVAYERELLPKRLSLGLSKPFYFNSERFDTPFEVMLKGLWVRGSWEAFLGPVLTWNIRVFEGERAEQEGEKNKMSFGIGAVTGAAYYFTRQWGLELELAYEYIPTDDIVEHEISTALSGVFRFSMKWGSDCHAAAAATVYGALLHLGRLPYPISAKHVARRLSTCGAATDAL